MSFGMLLAAALKITLIDLVLSGDNAVVIAMAARSLPKPQQKQAIFWGGVAAIALRVLVTTLIAVTMAVPFIQLGGGILLFYIAVKLLKGGEEEQNVKSGTTVWGAVSTIVLADFVMSVDNMLAVGGASEGHLGLLLLGLAISMGFILFASGWVADMMNRYGWLVYAGAAILAWTAGEMILHDRWLAAHFHPSHLLGYLVPGAMALAALAIGYAMNRGSDPEAGV
jgi:YjbE family integral membrane protein